MLAILVIFAFVVVLFFISIRIIDSILVIRNNFAVGTVRIGFTAISFFLWFVFGALMTLLVSYSSLNLSQLVWSDSQKTIENSFIEPQDCQVLIDKIYQIENKIYQIENHRYIEETFTASNTKAKYQEGAAKLNATAKEYLSLNVSSNSQNYTQQLAETLVDKAQLFQQRTKIPEKNQKLQKVRRLITKMDRVTQHRRNLINAVEKQCNV